MTAWQLIRTHLASDSSVTTLATGGIYPVRGKQGEKRPQIIGRQIGGEDLEALDGAVMKVAATLDVGCVAHEDFGGGGLGYDASVTLFEAVKASLRAMRKTTVSTKRIETVRISAIRDEDVPDWNLVGVLFTVEIKFQR